VGAESAPGLQRHALASFLFVNGVLPALPGAAL
jgi:hypothetical protein